MSSAHFSPALFAYLKDLKRNNDRAWFKEHQDRYESALREPSLAFIRDFEAPLEAISPHFVASAKKVGGSLFRIQRDTRFGKDKTPYKTQVGIHFRHEQAKSAHAPGFYLHLEPGECFVGVGLWRPDPPVARQIRAAIAEDPKAWKKAISGKAFTASFALSGESLKRTPKPWSDDHPAAEDLRRKDFIAVKQVSVAAVTSPGFLKEVAKDFKSAAPLMRFLCQAVDVPF
ncbi:MAG: DUF2461 domain-containing protein [Deltaproteobacteria bacterium]|nr:DUF2461 domain-containing protein [Deltaproteobacteria bacterium]